MIAPDELVAYAAFITQAENVSEVDCRRAISAAYYGLFHTLVQAASAIVSADDRLIRARLERTFEHKTVRKACEQIQIGAARRSDVAREMIPLKVDQRLIEIARSFSLLQEARLTADYDLHTSIIPAFAKERVERAVTATRALKEIARLPETRLFFALFYFVDRRGPRG